MQCLLAPQQNRYGMELHDECDHHTNNHMMKCLRAHTSSLLLWRPQHHQDPIAGNACSTYQHLQINPVGEGKQEKREMTY